MSLKIHTKTKICVSMYMDNSFSCTFKMKFKLWQCIRKININIKSLLILIQEKNSDSHFLLWDKSIFFGGYLCNVTLFISLDHLNKLWIIRRFKTLPYTQNLLFNIYIISKSKHAQKEYMTDIKSFFILHFQTKSSSLKRILNVYRVNYLRMLMACDLPFQHDSRSL